MTQNDTERTPRERSNGGTSMVHRGTRATAASILYGIPSHGQLILSHPVVYAGCQAHIALYLAVWELKSHGDQQLDLRYNCKSGPSRVAAASRDKSHGESRSRSHSAAVGDQTPLRSDVIWCHFPG